MSEPRVSSVRYRIQIYVASNIIDEINNGRDFKKGNDANNLRYR